MAIWRAKPYGHDSWSHAVDQAGLTLEPLLVIADEGVNGVSGTRDLRDCSRRPELD